MVNFSLFNKIKYELLNNGLSSTFLIHNSWGKKCDIEKYLDEKKLNYIIKKYKDKPFARHYRDDFSNDNRSSYGHREMNIDYKLIDLISKEYDCKYTSTGRYWYKPNEFLGWHTNSNLLGERLYVVWAEEDNKSFFKYKDKKTGKIITKWEKKGWQINRFEPPIWHCVGSYTNRVSFGFKKLLLDETLDGDRL